MASPENAELLSFRRAFTLLILLVVLPSAGLSGFGVLAIVNERAAVEKRLESVWVGRLNAVQAELMSALTDAQVTSTEPTLVLERNGKPLTDLGFSVDDDGVVHSSNPHIETAVKALGPELAAAPTRPVVFSVTSPQGTFLLAVMRVGGRVVGAQLSAEAVETLLRGFAAKVTPPGEEASFGLVPIKREAPPEGVMARLVSGVSEVKEALGARELASVVLPAPLQDFRLVAQATGEDPVATASTRNRVLYSVLLGVFYVTLALGVVYTGRTLYREARLSRLKTDFVSLVSHELRTPLTSIRMFIEMISMGRVKDPVEMQTVVDLLSKETARLSMMIESVLDWSRIESGKKQYRKEKQKVDALIDTAVSAFRAQHIDAPPQLAITVAPAVGEIEIDLQSVSGALLNLLQNAWKYSKEDDKRVELRVVRDDDFIVVEVEDHGVGIPRREQKRIFDRFYRVDTLLTRATEGSGLGLSIAQRIVQAHDGWISVDSVPGQGSTFRIHLPATQS